MSRLVWDKPDQRWYETGIDRGVLYPSSGPGVVWNGLIGVDESAEGGEMTPLYSDGRKILNLVSNRFYKAKLRSFSAPLEFANCNGERQVRPGVMLTHQPRDRFGLSYRTMVTEKHYKIHLVYNATTKPGPVIYQTMSNDSAPMTLEWDIDAVPAPNQRFKPTAHVVLDSRLVAEEYLRLIEGYLYGQESVDDTFLDGGSPANPGIGFVDGNVLTGDIIDGNASETSIAREPLLLTPIQILGILDGVDYG